MLVEVLDEVLLELQLPRQLLRLEVAQGPLLGLLDLLGFHFRYFHKV